MKTFLCPRGKMTLRKGIVLGTVLGGLLNKRISHALFTKLVYASLALMGAVMLLREIF